MDYSAKLAQIALEIGALRLNPEAPFTWASGNRMPVYNDNRLLLGEASHRQLVAEAMAGIVREQNLEVDVVAGTATAGIPHATSLANLLGTPLIYVRASAKEHGLQNRIEGPLRENQSVLVVEDLVSTGGSALKAVEAVRQAGARAEACICIFSYGFSEAVERFQALNCRLFALLDFPALVRHAAATGSLTDNQVALLEDWYRDPFGWARAHGHSP